MSIWNDTDTPLAYLITVRTYGTWLHGDERGSVDRFMNKYGSPRIPRRDARHAYNQSIMKGEPVLLDVRMRSAVEDAIREVCEYKGWPLHAINVRTNHFHNVTTTLGLKPGRTLNAFKSYATRKMRERGLWLPERTPWADKGSERWLWTEESIIRACDTSSTARAAICVISTRGGSEPPRVSGWVFPRSGQKNPPANAGWF